LLATREEAAKVVADLHEKAEQCKDTTLGRREKQALYNAASMVEAAYGIGAFV
jgi:vacuolar-type H+-ATPase subunit H